jgi:ABC-2 type transport system permease protein
MVLFTVIFMPLLFAALPLIILYSTGRTAERRDGRRNACPVRGQCARGDERERMLPGYIVSQFMIMFMLVPLIIPVNIAAYSIVGEKPPAAWSPCWQPRLPPSSCWPARTWQR